MTWLFSLNSCFSLSVLLWSLHKILLCSYWFSRFSLNLYFTCGYLQLAAQQLVLISNHKYQHATDAPYLILAVKQKRLEYQKYRSQHIKAQNRHTLLNLAILIIFQNLTIRIAFLLQRYLLACSDIYCSFHKLIQFMFGKKLPFIDAVYIYKFIRILNHSCIQGYCSLSDSNTLYLMHDLPKVNKMKKIETCT